MYVLQYRMAEYSAACVDDWLPYSSIDRAAQRQIAFHKFDHKAIALRRAIIVLLMIDRDAARLQLFQKERDGHGMQRHKITAIKH